MIKINPQFLSILKHRFDEQVSESDIIAWLYNFEEKDWETALILLSNVSYYSDNRCCNILESGLNRILNECENLPIVFFPIEVLRLKKKKQLTSEDAIKIDAIKKLLEYNKMQRLNDIKNLL